MTEARLYEAGTIPEWTTPGWYAERETAPHLEQPGHRERLLLAADMIRAAITEHHLNRVLDLGAGDGGLLSTLAGLGVERVGYDLQQSNADAAAFNRGITVAVRDIVADPPAWGPATATCAVATEMLEHLADPHAFVRSIPAKVLIASSPFTETNGGAYPFHTWAWDLDGYRALIEQAGYTVVRHETVSIFQVVAAVRP